MIAGIAGMGLLLLAVLSLRGASPTASPTHSDPRVPDREPPEAPPQPHTTLKGEMRPRAQHTGLELGTEPGPQARATAQAILDDALAELRRLDARHRTHARNVYMRGHSAAERVEDELEADDEPGHAKVRADEDAMKAELRRIYGVDDVTPRP